MADVSVRPALPADAGRIGAIHAAAMRRTLTATVGPLPAEVVRVLDATDVVAAWRTAVTAPPSPLHRVLTALDGATVVGFAAFARATPAPGGVGDVPGAELVALEIDPAHTRAGHASRLLAAGVDLLRRQGAMSLLAWSVSGDEARTRFLSSAGFAPLGWRRGFDVGGRELVELAWHAALT